MPLRTLGNGRDVERLSFDAYVRSRSTALLRTAYLLTGDQHLAEDLVQTALLKAHGKWDAISYEGNPEPYVRKIMYHLQASVWRRRRVAEALTADVPTSRTEDESGNAALRVALRAALLTLPPRQRAVVVLRYFEDRTEAETAEILGCSIGTVKSQHSRAVARLRLAPQLGDITIDIAEGGVR